MKPSHRKSFAGKILCSALTFGPSFKVKRWFTGFGELSFQWIQISVLGLVDIETMLKLTLVILVLTLTNMINIEMLMNDNKTTESL